MHPEPTTYPNANFLPAVDSCFDGRAWGDNTWTFLCPPPAILPTIHLSTSYIAPIHVTFTCLGTWSYPVWTVFSTVRRVCWDWAENWVSYYISATWKERTVELLQIENKQHNWSQQISWTVSNKKKKKTQAVCSGLDSNCVHQSFLSLAHINKSNRRICLRTETYHICFLLDCTTRMESGKCTDLQTSGRIAELLAHYFEIERTEWLTALPSPEEQRYHRLNWPGACCDRSGRRTKKKKKKDRADCNVNFSDGV